MSIFRKMASVGATTFLLASITGFAAAGTAHAGTYSFGSSFPYTTTTMSAPADGVSLINLAFGTSSGSNVGSLMVLVSGARFAFGTGDFNTALVSPTMAVVSPAAGSVNLAPGDNLVLQAPTQPGNATVSVYWIDANTGVAVLDSATTFTFVGGFTTPTTIQQCLAGGWQNLADAHGIAFKNEGDCVSFVASGGRNGAAGS